MLVVERKSVVDAIRSGEGGREWRLISQGYTTITVHRDYGYV